MTNLPRRGRLSRMSIVPPSEPHASPNTDTSATTRKTDSAQIAAQALRAPATADEQPQTAPLGNQRLPTPSAAAPPQAPVNIVDLIRATLAGATGGPVTEAVPVTSTVPPALNDITGLLRSALTGAYTVNGEPHDGD
jgi:hypothetical protein